MNKLLGAALLTTFVVMGCNDPTKDKPKATTGEAVATATATAATTAAANKPAAGQTTYAFDNTGSKVAFVGAKVTGKHDGSFGAFRGKVMVPGTELEKGSVNVEIDTASVTADDPKLTGHLKTGDFFEVDKFPKATFQSTSVEKGGAGGATHTIKGNLTLHGVTKSISFPAKVALEGDMVNVDAEFGINRKEFGIVYNGMADNAIKDEVLIKLTIRAKKS